MGLSGKLKGYKTGGEGLPRSLETMRMGRGGWHEKAKRFCVTNSKGPLSVDGRIRKSPRPEKGLILREKVSGVCGELEFKQDESSRRKKERYPHSVCGTKRARKWSKAKEQEFNVSMTLLKITGKKYFGSRACRRCWLV